MARGASFTPEGSDTGYPDSSTYQAYIDQASQILYLETRLKEETASHTQTKQLLHERDREVSFLTEQLRKTEEMLEVERKKSWAAHTAEMYRDMNSGQALIATVGAPLMAAPLAVTMVVKGFEDVGYGIASLFKGKGTQETGKEGASASGGTASASASTAEATAKAN